jgi:hypothetical protein
MSELNHEIGVADLPGPAMKERTDECEDNRFMHGSAPQL